MPIYSTGLAGRFSIVELEQLLSRGECHALIEAARDKGFKRSGLHGRFNQEAFLDRERIARRFISILSNRLTRLVNTRVLVAPRLEFYRYADADHLSRHTDAVFRLNGKTYAHALLVYLNATYMGGKLVFDAAPVRTQVRQGKGVIFYKPLFHRTRPMRQGMKYVLRIDISITST